MRPTIAIQSLVFAGLAAFAAFAAGAFAQKTQLLVYTALETDQIKAYADGFNKVHPDVEIKWVRDSTGVMLVPCAPLNLDAIMSQYRDKKKVPAWRGMDVWGATICFNTVEAKKKNIPRPESWQDLTKPVYKG